MPTDLYPKRAVSTGFLTFDDEQKEFLLLLSFALSPIIVLLLLFLLSGPKIMEQSLDFGETVYVGL